MPSVVEASTLPRPREGCFLHCVRCGAALFYVRPERGVEHHFACRRCGQKARGVGDVGAVRAPRAVRDGRDATSRIQRNRRAGIELGLSGNKGYCNAFNWAEELCASEFPTKHGKLVGGPEHVNAHDGHGDGMAVSNTPASESPFPHRES